MAIILHTWSLFKLKVALPRFLNRSLSSTNMDVTMNKVTIPEEWKGWYFENDFLKVIALFRATYVLHR